MASPYRVLAWSLLPLLGWRIRRVDGLEHLPAGGCILVANHQSWIDSAIVAGAVYRHIGKSLRFVAQSSKYRIFGGIPINEYDPASVLEVAEGYLRAGHPIVIFPEGNSNPNPQLRLGKTGAARLALHTGTPVIPLGIRGTRGVNPLAALGWFGRWWQPCEVVIGPPITFPPVPTEIAKEELESATNRIMGAISAVSGKPYSAATSQRAVRRPSYLRRFLRGVVLPTLRFRVKVAGAEHLPAQGPFIVAANHSSYFDPGSVMIAVYVMRKIQPYFLTKGAIARTWRNLLGSQAWDVLGMLPIDNRDKSAVLNSAIAILRHNGVVGIFPEGTRNKPSINPDWQTTMLRAKTGAARLALTTGCPVIPTAIVAPRGLGILQTVMNVIAFWKPSFVTFGPPLQFAPVPADQQTRELLETTTRAIITQIAAMTGKRYPH